MERRTFIRTATAAVSMASLMPLSGCGSKDLKAEQGLLSRLMRLNDGTIENILDRQELNTQHRWFGGVKNAYGIHAPGGAAGLLQNLTVAFVSPQSKYHVDDRLRLAMERAIDYLIKVQHEDGTIDLLSTNFHSTPDTGFVVEPVCLAYTIASQRSQENILRPILDKMQTFLLNAGRALSIGGIHTPNHRWVVSMALSRIHQLFPNKTYLARIDQWLAEGIDIDPDGQYTEQSTAVYSPLTDRCLITLARLLDRPELLEPVRQNLEMTIYYIHPNGEVVTEASGRQDQFRIAFPDQYYYPYRYLAIKDNNGRFSAMAANIEKTSFSRLNRNLPLLLEDPFLERPLPAPVALPMDYRKTFIHSNLIRIRRGETDATILGENHTFFSFFKGAAALQAIQLSMAFFGKGEFKTEQIEEVDGKLILRWELTKGYYQLFPEEDLPDDGDWEKMPRDERPLSEVQTLRAEVTISEQNGGFELAFAIAGTDDVPIAIELAFRHGGELSNVKPAPRVASAFLLGEGFGQYDFAGDQIRFGPGRADHGWTQLRGGLPKKNAMSVYLTGYTPFHHKLQIA